MSLSRRAFLAESAAATAWIASSSLRAADGAGSDTWPLFRGDAAATGVARTKLPEKLEVLWSKEIPKGAFDATAAIVNGVAYLGDLDGTFYAFDLTTGKERWTQKRDTSFNASAGARDGKLYVGDVDGKFYCLKQETGEELWNFTTEAEINGGPNFWNDNVLIGSQDATLYCLNAKTGAEVWKFKIDDQIRCSPTVVGDRSFVAGCDSRFHIVDLTKGEEVAAVPIDAPTGVTPAVLGDLVYFGTEAGVLFAINWREGTVAWKSEEKSGSQAYRASPAVTPEQVIVGSRARRVRALHPKTGEELWSFATKQRIDSSPLIVGDRVFVGAADGRLYALDRNTGKEVPGKFEGKGGFTASPAAAEGKMVIATDRGWVYCLGSKG